MLYLASKSPRRRELLSQIGLEFDLVDVWVDEQRAVGEPPDAYVVRVAREKAEAGLARLAGRQDVLVLAADTEVIADDTVFGKPVDRDQAAAMLARLAGRDHRVLSAVWLMTEDRAECVQSRSRVWFAALSDAEIAHYVDSGEWRDKAGGYAIQGRAAALIERLDGSYSGVMGLPLFETRRLLAAFGVRV
ncbi:MAG TPA: septum formation inhibitor Maf [Xanthomonadales bacterium]|nr:septum formation inhibitor Maf [Xanthomonadales bacterium]